MDSKRLVFFGTEEFSSFIFEALIYAGYEFAVLVTKPDTSKGRGKHLSPPAVKILAQTHSIPVLQPADLEKSIQDIAAYQCSCAVLAAYGKIIPKALLNSFPGGIVNVHPSLLPVYRGPSPIESAILNGDDKTGVSIMKLSETMDTGPIYAQQPYALQGNETRPELYKLLADQSAALLLKHLPKILAGNLTPTPQDEAMVTYTSLIKKSDGIIDWHQTAEQIERQIRAYLSWPGSRTQIFDQEVIIEQARVDTTDLEPGQTIIKHSKIFIGAGKHSLEIEKLRPSGRNSMSGADFLKGLR